MIDVAYAQAAGSAPAGRPFGSDLIQFLPFVAIFLIVYLMILRPQSKRQKQLQKMIAELKRGDRVVTAGGIYGEVAEIKDATIVLRIADNTKVEFTKQSIVGVQSSK
jgi:preprotein translocase subunit YajC